MFPPLRSELLWHYTSGPALLGILNEQPANRLAGRLKQPSKLGSGAVSLWFTDAQYLNDPQELIFGHDILAEAIRQAVDAAPTTSDGAREDIDGVLRWLDDPVDSATGARRVSEGGAYVACFSQNADSLSQWRGYAGGRGYCLGFNPHAINTMWAPIGEAAVAEALRVQDITDGSPEAQAEWRTKMKFSQPQVGRVEYGEDAARDLFNTMAPGIVRPDSSIRRIFLCHAALSMVKQKAYEAEQEARAVVLSDVIPFDVSFRDGGSLGLIPYIVVSHLPFGFRHPRALHEIVVGPGDDLPLREQAIVQMVKQYQLDGVAVSASKILFRG